MLQNDKPFRELSDCIVLNDELKPSLYGRVLGFSEKGFLAGDTAGQHQGKNSIKPSICIRTLG